MESSSQSQKDKPVVINAESFNKKNLFKFSFVNPKLLGMITVLLLLVGGVGTGVYLTQKPQQTTTQATLSGVNLSLQPAIITANINSDFNIDIFADAGTNQVTGTDITINYDPRLLELKSINPKQFLPKVVREPIIASGSATITLGTDGTSGISGGGILASLVFSPMSDGSSMTQITFNDLKTHVNVLGSNADLKGNLAPTQVSIAGPLESTPQPSSPSRLESSPLEASNTSTTTSEFDFNGDQNINSVDLSVIYSAWGQPENEIQEKADLNGDGVVNGLDYAKFLPNFRR